MNIRVLDNYEVRRMDPMNWRVWQLKELERGERKGEVAWVGLESYHATVAAAVEWIARNAPKSLPDGDVDLDGAIARLRGIERDMGRHAKAFEETMKR